MDTKQKLISEQSEKLFLQLRDTPEGIPLPAGPGCARAMGCPLQFLSSPRLVSLCSCLSQICSDIPSRSCWSLELSANHLLLLMRIGCTGQSRGRVQGREAINNPPTAGMEPIAPSSCGGSWKEGFLGLGCLLLLSFERRAGGKRWIGI